MGKQLNVKCVAYNDIGYVEDVSQEHVTYHPESVELTGPSSVLASEEATFSCSSDLAYPAPSLMWSPDGQDATRDADQTDNEQSEGGITSVSVLRLNPTMGGHNHLVKCFVGGLDIYREASLTVEELYEEDAYNDDSYEDDYSEENEEYEEDIDNEYNYDEDEENKNDDSQYDNKENHNAAEKEVKEEIEYDYKEEEDNHEQGEEANYLTDYNEASFQDDHTETTNSVEQDLSAEEDDNNDEEEYNYDEDEYDYDEDDYNKTKEENVQDDKTEAVSQNNYEDSADLVEQELSTEKEDNIDESITDENNKYDENDATDYKEKEPVIEESFDATEQQQSFAAAEPGSAVLSHESDSSKHISADMFSPKPLFSSSQRIWSVNILVCISVCSITRLLS